MITGGRILGVKGQKMKDGQLDSLNVNLNLEEVKSEKTRAVIKYTYTVKYEKELAEIAVSGEVYVEGPEQKEIEESWKKTKQLPVAFAEELLTTIGYTGSAVGTLIAFALNINAPINVQKVKLQQPSQQAS